jgi:hypothetical protein
VEDRELSPVRREVTSLFFEGFLNGVSIEADSSVPSVAGFNFNVQLIARPRSTPFMQSHQIPSTV